MTRYLALMAVVAAFTLGGSGGPISHAASAQATCSRATALEVARPLFVWGENVRTPIRQVLCGPFTGPGSNAMAVTLVAPTCWPVQGWALYRFVGGGWQPVMSRPYVFIFRLDAVGADIRETAPVFRPGDSRCTPSGGRRARLWHWNGIRLVGGPWRRVASGGPTEAPVRTGHFKTPSGNIVCFHSPGPADMPRVFLGCGIKSGLKPPPPRRPCREGGYAGDRVELGATGRVSVPSCAGDPGALVGERSARVLGYGKTWSGGGIRCTSAVAGLTCRNRSGHGFFLSRQRWRAF